jgi:cation transport ATPase
MLRLCTIALLMLPLHAEFFQIDQKFGGMECASCSQSLPAAFRRMRGVESAEVDAKQSVLRLTLAAGNRVRLNAVRDAVKGAGFTPGEAQVYVAGQTESGQFVVAGTGERFQYEGSAAGRLRGSIRVSSDPRVLPAFVADRKTH